MESQVEEPLLPPSPVSPDGRQSKQRTIQLHRGAGEAKTLPWIVDKHQPQTPLTTQMAGTPRLRLPKRRTMSTGRSSTSSHTAVESTMLQAEFGDIPEDSVSVDMGHVRGTRSMSAVRSSIALSSTSRASLSHRLSQSSQRLAGATSPTLPIVARPRFNSAMSSFRPASADTYAGAELTIRLSMDASQAREYRMLLEGDSVISDLRYLQDEHQRTVAPSALSGRLIAVYFAATWSTDCDDFTPQLASVAAAHRDDLAVVHVSLDHHPADMARMMAGTGWLSVPWSEHGRRQRLAKRLGVAAAADVPRLVIVDSHTHRVVAASACADVERQPLTCVREWRRRARQTWWNSAKWWVPGSVLLLLAAWYVVLFIYSLLHL